MPSFAETLVLPSRKLTKFLGVMPSDIVKDAVTSTVCLVPSVPARETFQKPEVLTKTAVELLAEAVLMP